MKNLTFSTPPIEMRFEIKNPRGFWSSGMPGPAPIVDLTNLVDEPMDQELNRLSAQPPWRLVRADVVLSKLPNGAGMLWRMGTSDRGPIVVGRTL